MHDCSVFASQAGVMWLPHTFPVPGHVAVQGVAEEERGVRVEDGGNEVVVIEVCGEGEL